MVLKSLMLNKAAFVLAKIQLNSNIEILHEAFLLKLLPVLKTVFAAWKL